MAIQAKPLTNTEVKAAKATDKELSLHDGGGLLLFVKPSGTKTWRFRYYHPQTKKRTTLTFGSYPALSLADARQMREAAKALLEKRHRSAIPPATAARTRAGAQSEHLCQSLR